MSDTNANALPFSHSRAKTKRLTMADIPAEQQHQYVEWHGKPYHVGSLPPSVVERIRAGTQKLDVTGGFKVVRHDMKSANDYMLPLVVGSTLLDKQARITQSIEANDYDS